MIQQGKGCQPHSAVSPPMMGSTQVRLLILAQLLILIPSTQAGKDKQDALADYMGFLETPLDVEFKNQREIAMFCRYSVPIRKCRWFKDDWIVRWKNEWHVRFVFNESQGLCNIVIRRPQMGIDTSKWKCQVEKLDGKLDTSPEIVIFAKNVPRTNYYDNFVQYQSMHMSQTQHKQATVHLEMLTLFETRIRWYVDGKMVQSLYDEKIDLLEVDSTRVFASTTIDLSKLGKGQFKVVRCCVEFKSELKKYKIFTVYVTSTDYDIDYRLAKENTVPQVYSVKPPKPFLIVDGDQVSDVFLRFEVSYPTLHEVHFICGEIDAFPSSVLMWQVITTEVDAASDLLEFNRTEQALEESETISLHAIFKNPSSKIIVACHAFNILAPNMNHKVAQIHISLKYVAPTCPSKPNNSPNGLISSFSPTTVSVRVHIIFIAAIFQIFM